MRGEISWEDLSGVVVGLAHDIDEVAEAGQGHLPEPEFQLDHRVEDRAGQILVGREVDHQPLHAPHALGHFEDAGEHALDHHGMALVAIRLRERAQALDALRVAGVGPRVGAHVACRQPLAIQGRLDDREIQPALPGLVLRHAPLVDERPVLARVADVDLPVVAVQGEQAAHVHAQALDDVIAGQRQPLDHVADVRLDGRQSEVRPQAPVGHDVDAGDLGAAEIEGNAVGFPVVDRREQPFARGHGALYVEATFGFAQAREASTSIPNPEPRQPVR